MRKSFGPGFVFLGIKLLLLGYGKMVPRFKKLGTGLVVGTVFLDDLFGHNNHFSFFPHKLILCLE